MSNCADCIYWHSVRGGNGECRYNAPQTSGKPHPMRNGFEWCGKHAPKVGGKSFSEMRRIKKLDFLGLFTIAEQRDIKKLIKNGDEVVDSFWDMLKLSKNIDLGHPAVELGLSYLSVTPVVDGGNPVLAEGRKEQILKNKNPE